MLKNIVERLMNLSLLLDAAGDGSGGGAGDGAEGGTPPADNGGKPQGGSGQGDGQAGEKKPAQGQGQPDDSRYRGMLADLQKERTARQKFERELAAERVSLEQERRRVQALAGVNPKSAEESDLELVRQRLAQLNPALTDLTAEDIAAIRALKGQMADMQTATEQQWTTHGAKMLDAVKTGMETALGGPLSDRQFARLSRAYAAEAANDPQFLARHEAGDPKLVAQFIKDWMEDFVEPGKRQALAAELQRRPRVPTGKDRSVVGQGGKKIDVTNDEQVADLLVAGFRERGGQFGQR